MTEGQEIRARWFDRFLNPYRPTGGGFDAATGMAWVAMSPYWWHPVTWWLRLTHRPHDTPTIDPEAS